MTAHISTRQAYTQATTCSLNPAGDARHPTATPRERRLLAEPELIRGETFFFTKQSKARNEARESQRWEITPMYNTSISF